MNELALHHGLTLLQIGLAGLVFVALLLIDAPYGRHNRAGWGPQIPNKWGWLLMEAPAVFLFGGVYLAGDHAGGTVPLVLLALWQIHYVHRTFIFPLRTRTSGKTMPASVVLMAVVFNSLNAYINARWISHFGEYALSWLTDPRFLVGAAVFVAGFVINYLADRTLIRLRAPGETGYRIPQGGLYRYVSCPNYLGEIVEWIGWAIATWSLPGLAFAVFAAANVGPRAMANHRWYQERFEDYPAERKALIPFVI